MIQYSSIIKEDMLRCAVALVPVLSRKDKIVYRFKGFDSSLCGDNMAALEAMVNAWMEGECPRIRQMCQSIRGQHILLSFVYEDIQELERRVSTQTQVTAITGAFPRIFNDDKIDDRPTSPSIPATPPPM
jgi:hypothetical protein